MQFETEAGGKEALCTRRWKEMNWTQERMRSIRRFSDYSGQSRETLETPDECLGMDDLADGFSAAKILKRA